MGGVGVFFRIAVGMMHAMEDGVGPGIEEGAALGDEGEGVEEFLPERMHFEHLMWRIPVKEEGLWKEREEPVTEKKH